MSDRKCRRVAALVSGLAMVSFTLGSERAGAQTPQEEGFLDAAPFARVCTWDPQRDAGVRATRLQEIAAEDLFLGTDLVPDQDGHYQVPPAANGQACIGLQWVEARPLSMLHIEFQTSLTGQGKIQFWQGETLWQGKWVDVDGQLDTGGSAWAFAPAKPGGLYWKIRWIIPAEGKPVGVKRLSAFTSSPTTTSEIVIQCDPAKPGQTAELEMYNGRIGLGQGSAIHKSWNMGSPLELTVQHTKLDATRKVRADRTAIRFRLPDGAFAVAIDDILERGPVYLPHVGLFVSKAPPAKGLEEYKREIASKKTVLEQVRAMPDQTREQAMAKTHCDRRLDAGRMMISLACDNAKFVTEANGKITYFDDFSQDRRAAKATYTFTPMYLTELVSPTTKLDRHLEGGWLPAPVITGQGGGIERRQRTYVVPFAKENLSGAPLWLNAKPLCVVELTMKNGKAEPAEVTASFLLAMGDAAAPPASVETTPTRAVIASGGQLLGVVDSGELTGGRIQGDGGRITLSGQLPAAGSARCFLYLPAWKMTPDQQAELSGGPELFDRFKAYWEAIMAKGTQIDLPDAWIANVIRANQVHILLAARNEQQGKLIVPWIASDRYLVAVNSEGNSPIRGMEYWGHLDFAQRSFEYFFTKYRPEGFMTMGYTLMGNGWHLWALGEYLQLARDDDWFKSVADKPAGLCRWVMAQLAKTRKLKPDGQKMREYGLMPPGVEADWNAYAYYFYANSYFRAGLEATGRAMKGAGHPDADKVLAAAEDLRKEIVRAFKETQALAPVVPLQNGTWVPYYPASVYTPGPMADYYPGQDGNRSWCYDVDLGAHHMIAMGAMKPDAPDVDWIMNHMEDVHFLSEGWGGYPAVRNHEDWFDMGGFAKVQPYYCRNAEICAIRDDVKPFVRSYFNTLAALIDGTCLSIFEHFSNFCYNKTHETGYFLHQSRTMLVTERGDELWLAPLVTDNWLKDGMTLSVGNAPTFFGPVSYKIVSSVASGHIDATIEPPTRSAPKAIVLRLRHPEGKAIKSVQVNGRPHSDFDAGKEIVRLMPTGETIRIEVRY